MRIAGRDQAIGNIVKWSAMDDWAPYREEVFASHLDPVMENLGVTGDELAEALGDALDMLYGVILEDFFTARFGDDGELNVIDDYLKRRGWREKVPVVVDVGHVNVHVVESMFFVRPEAAAELHP